MGKTAPDLKKLRGGYYTPEAIARVLSNWAIRQADDRILEPSSGDGIFLQTAMARLRQLGAVSDDIQAVEIDPIAADRSSAVLATGRGGKLHRGDFFGWAAHAHFAGERYDAIIGNPPFLRFAYFEDAHRKVAFEVMRKLGLRPTKLTNAWVAFAAISCALLTPNGRMAMVLPAELLQVTYAAELRKFLAEYFHRITIVAFDKLVFDGIQQEVVLLAAERGAGNRAGIHVAETADNSTLSEADLAEPSAMASLDHGTEKWTQYFLEPGELQLVRHLRANPGLRPLSDFASVDVGVVTGLNDFFVLDANGTTPAGLKEVSVPIITRSHQLRGASITATDWAAFASGGHARLLLALNNDDEPTGDVADYLAQGVDRSVPLGYKCRIRRKWYVVPSVWRPSGFMLRQIHLHPKLVVNTTPATSTDTVHRVAFKDEWAARGVTAAFHNSATFLLSELEGRSYGGGVLELEPTEAERLLIPIPSGRPRFADVDSALRASDTIRLLRNGDSELRKVADLSLSEVTTIRQGWERLRDRRLSRKTRTRGLVSQESA